MKKIVFLFILLSVSFIITAASLPGKNIGPAVSQHNGRDLKWEEGSRDYFTLFRTMLSRSAAGNPTESSENPQADGCLMSSSKGIVSGNLPDDAVVTDAFIIWTTAHTPDNPAATDRQQYNNPTDNMITLKFDNGNGIALNKEIAASQAYTIGASQGFEFEGAIYEMDLHLYRMGVYTYRAEITDLFYEILSAGREDGLTQDGKAYEGNYTVEGLSCYNGDPFYKTTMMVSNWAIVFVYTSSKIKPKKIYMYNGLNFYRDTQSTLFVSGFELPEDPSVRVSLLTAEGDPGLYSSVFQPEGLLFRANDTQQHVALSNICNPQMSGYTEVYNSISSYFPWDAGDDATPSCIGGQGGNTAIADITAMDWAVDFDTFLINETTYPGYLSIGDKDFEFIVSANQDTIFSNMMIVSVDTKSPKFDIPESGSSKVIPHGREKHSCSCASEEDLICNDERPFYYLVRVQNWGEDKASNVTIKDTLPNEVSYVPGTTEIATKFDESGNGLNWTYIPDTADDGFPFAAPYEVSGEMLPCDKNLSTCEHTVLARFLVKPKSGLPKHTVINNSAEISDSSGGVYKSNSDVTYKIRMAASCPVITECSEPERAACGGDKTDGEDPDDEASFAKNTEVEFSKGKNSPASDDEIIIPSPAEKLVLGQLEFTGINKDYEGKNFKLNTVTIKTNINDNDTSLINFILVYDINGNGKIDTEDTEISSSSIDNGSVAFIVNNKNRLFKVNTTHNLLFAADVSYIEENISINAIFNVEIEDENALTAQDGGTATVKGSKIEFQKFMLEPTSGYFIVTKGMNDPAVPAPDTINSNISLMQLRLKSVDGENEITSLTVKTSGTKYVEFDKGIKSLSIYVDTDGDGEVHTSLGDVKVAETSDFDTSRSHVFKNISIKFNNKEEKHLLINAVLDIGSGEIAKINIPNSGVELKTAKSIYKLPISSKEFINDCDPYDPLCAADDEENGCSALKIANTGTDHSFLMLLISFFAGLFISITLIPRKK